MVATSVLQGRPGLECLAPAVYAYLSADVDKCHCLVNVEHIPDLEYLDKVKKVLNFIQDKKVIKME